MKNKVRQHQIDLILLYLFPVLSYYGYNYVGLNQTLMKALYFVALPLMIIYVWRILIRRTNSKYFMRVRLLSLLMVLSMAMAFILWGQPFMLSYRATAGSFAIIYYFFLIKGDFTRKEIENYIWINAFLWIILWFYALSKAPVPVFTVDAERELSDARGIFRISIPGSACVIMAYFMSLNKWVCTKKKRFMVFVVLFFVFIVLMTVRQIIIFSFIVGVYYIIRKVKYSWLYIVFLFLGLNLISIKLDSDSVIGSLIELTEKQLDEQKKGDTNIRLLEYEYYFTEYNNNPLAILFGNGNSHTEHSFGRRDLRIQETLRYFQNDVGYANIYIMLGLLGLIVFIRLLLTPVRQKISKDMMYPKLFIVYLIFVTFGASWFFSYIIIFCLAIYLLDKYGKETS